MLGAAAIGLVLVRTAPDFRLQQWTLWLVYGVLALSFTFVWGHAGIFSFGQAAFFGIGAYGYGAAGINLSLLTGESLSAVLVAASAAALAAGVLGYFIFYGNVSDVYVAIITLAVTLVLLTVVSSTGDPRYRIGEAPIGGYNGMVGIPPLTVWTPGGPLALDFAAFFLFVLVLAALVTAAVRLLLRRPFGRIVAGVRENELRTQLLGYDVRRYKLLAFMLGGALAGLAGALYASWSLFISPVVFGLQQAALVAIWVLVGGRTSLLGAFVGVAVVEGMSSALGGSGGAYTPIVLGAILIAVVLLLPEGIVPSLSALVRRARPARRSAAPLPASPEGSPALPPTGLAEGNPAAVPLEAVDLRKRFGGVTALDGASLTFAPQTVTCLIGPNGAGKSTFFNLLVGRYRPTAGDIRFGGRTITSLRPDQRAQLGLGIKLQVPALYRELPALENVWLAAYAKSRDSRRADRRALLVLDWLQLQSRASTPAGVLAHGQQQWLEIGMVLAGEPEVLLLDEPTAGMTREETLRTVELVRQVATRSTVVVVEHDMEFVRRLGAPVTLFHEGKVFAQGSIEDLRKDERVLDIYLGRAATHA